MQIDYLRISITDRCNLNCLYCNPDRRISFLKKEDILSYEEMAKVVELFSVKGISKVRLTGGEPLIRKDIASFIRMLKNIKNIKDISITTNGVLLKYMVKDLKIAGLNRVNISLDTLKADRFKLITRGENYFDVWDGIKKSIEEGLNPVKINVVLLKGINDDEILDFAKLSLEFPLIIRFIELFPVNSRLKESFGSMIINNEDVKQEIIKNFGKLESVSNVRGNGPAVYYKIKNSLGNIGFISSFSEDFCDRCNRIRIDSTGRIFPCLFSEPIYDVKKLIRTKAIDEIFKLIDEITKTKSLYRKRNIKDYKVEMGSIGG
jgi:cyclic pyranopterin phosphate synthase